MDQMCGVRQLSEKGKSISLNNKKREGALCGDNGFLSPKPDTKAAVGGAKGGEERWRSRKDLSVIALKSPMPARSAHRLWVKGRGIEKTSSRLKLEDLRERNCKRKQIILVLQTACSIDQESQAPQKSQGGIRWGAILLEKGGVCGGFP